MPARQPLTRATAGKTPVEANSGRLFAPALKEKDAPDRGRRSAFAMRAMQ